MEHLLWVLLKHFIYMSLLWSTNKVFLLENKIKETSNNQIYSFFETYSRETSIFDYFKLRMQACIIFLTAIVKMCNIFFYIVFRYFTLVFAVDIN